MRIPIQQRVVLSGRERENRFGGGYNEICKLRFRPIGWIAAIMALLFVSCASLTPDRIATLAAIAGIAANVGANLWLEEHPEQRPAWQLVIDALQNIHLTEANQAEFVARLESLPTSKLAAKPGEVYWSGSSTNPAVEPKPQILVWDSELKKVVKVEGPAAVPVMQATLSGLRRAVAPKPPMPPRIKRTGGPVLGSDAALDAEFEAVKAKLKSPK